jgi:hypothetical protein
MVTRILASPKTSLATTVNFFYDSSTRPGSEACLITQANTRSLFRTTATILGKKKIGYAATNIGTHSLRSGAAMALFLAIKQIRPQDHDSWTMVLRRLLGIYPASSPQMDLRDEQVDDEDRQLLPRTRPSFRPDPLQRLIASERPSHPGRLSCLSTRPSIRPLLL